MRGLMGAVGAGRNLSYGQPAGPNGIMPAPMEAPGKAPPPKIGRKKKIKEPMQPSEPETGPGGA